MENVATTLLDYILSLLDDPGAMADYLANREGALSAAGLGGCGDEVDAALTSAGAGQSMYLTPAKFHWSGHHDVYDKESDGDLIINESFNNNRIEDSFNTTITNIDDRDSFVNNGVFVGGDNEGEITNVGGGVTNVGGNVTNVEGNLTEIEFEENGRGDQVIAVGGNAANDGSAIQENNADFGDATAGGDGINVLPVAANVGAFAPVQANVPILSGNDTDDIALLPVASPVDQSEEAVADPADA